MTAGPGTFWHVCWSHIIEQALAVRMVCSLPYGPPTFLALEALEVQEVCKILQNFLSKGHI